MSSLELILLTLISLGPFSAAIWVAGENNHQIVAVPCAIGVFLSCIVTPYVGLFAMAGRSISTIVLVVIAYPASTVLSAVLLAHGLKKEVS